MSPPALSNPSSPPHSTKTNPTTPSSGNNPSSRIIGENNKNLKSMAPSINTVTKIGWLISPLPNTISASSSSKLIRNHGRGLSMNSKNLSSISTALKPWGTATIVQILPFSLKCNPTPRKVTVWKLNLNLLNTLMTPFARRPDLLVNSKARKIPMLPTKISLPCLPNLGGTLNRG